MPKKFNQELRKQLKEERKMKEFVEKAQNKLNELLIIKKASSNPYVCTRESSGGIEEVEMKSLKSAVFKCKEIIKTQSKKDSIFKIMKPTELKEKKKYNDWSFDEDLMLLRLCKVAKLNKKWRKIAKLIGNKKTPRMCSYRFKKLNKYVYINKHNELVKRKVKIEEKECLDIENIDMVNFNVKQIKRRKKLLSRKSGSKLEPELTKTHSRTDSTGNGDLNTIIKKKDSNISMEKEFALVVDYEKALNELNHLHLNENKANGHANQNIFTLDHASANTGPGTDYVFKLPELIPGRKISTKSSYGNKNISDLEIRSIPSIPSMNSGRNLTFTLKRSVSPIRELREHDFQAGGRAEFKKAYNTVFFGSEKRISTEGTNSNKDTDSIYYLNNLATAEVKLLPSDYVDNYNTNNTNNTFDLKRNTQDIRDLPPLKLKAIKELQEIDDIINSDRTFEEKNTKLAESLLNINATIKNEKFDETELKVLMMYQARVVQNMVSFSGPIKHNLD